MDRPLVFEVDCPTVILPREEALPLKKQCVALRVLFQADPFFTFERVRFPGRTKEEVEMLFDRLDRAERRSAERAVAMALAR